MIDEIYFKDDGKVNITAASVGISKRRWICANQSEIGNKPYFELMSKNRFDLLPIISKEEVKEYFIIKKPNDFTEIERKKIIFEDTLDLNTNIRNVIDNFSTKKRTFYFLTFRKEITGLITIGNLNRRQVQIYIFQHLCDLERTLGDFLNSKLNHDEIIEWIKGKSNPKKENDKYSEIIELYENLTKLDL